MQPIVGDPLLREIRRLAASDAQGQIADADLLARFVGRNDHSAFAALVDRHGPMVLRLCRRRLADQAAADDAFQATFLILVRKASSIRSPELLSSWLYGVALRVVRQAQEDAACRRKHEGRLAERVARDPGAEASWTELCHVLDEELDRLPERYRAAFLLCYVDGKTRDQAARQLGWSLRTLDRQLEKGRSLLQVRLTRRGITLAAVLLAVTSASEAIHAAELGLKAALLEACTALMQGADLASLSGARVGLAQAVLRGMALLKLKVNVAAWSCILLLGGVVAALGYFGRDSEPKDNLPAHQPDVLNAGPGKPKSATDALGDPMPADALLRLGTLRFRYDGVVRSLAFAKDGKSLLCAGWDKSIRRWNAQTGAELETLQGPDKGLLDAAVSADGKTLVGGTVDGKVHVWDLTTGKEIKQIAVPGGKVIRKVAIAPDGRTAAVAGDDNAVCLFDLKAGAELRVLATYKQQPNGLAFSPDGKLLASSSYDGTAHVHETESGKLVFQPKAKNGVIHALCFAPDGKTLLAGEESAVSFWDAATGQMQRRVEGVSGQLFTLVFAPDGKTFAGGTANGTIQLWDAASAKEIRKIKAHADNVQALAFSPDGSALASGGSERGVRLWDIATGKQLNTLIGHQERVSAVAVSPNGKVVATAGWDHCVRLWNADTGKELRRFDWPRKDNVPIGTSQSVHVLLFSPDGKLVAAAGYENKVWLWDLDKGEVVRTFPGICADFTPDGKHIVTGGWTPVARLYETATGKEVREFQGHLSGITDLKFLPDGKTLVSASIGAPMGFRTQGEKWDKQTIWLWDVATAKVRRQFGGEYRPGGLAISPDGRMLSAAIGFRENVVHVWELASGTERAVLRGHGEMIFATAISPDGKFLATGSMDNTLRLWRLPGGKHVHTFAGHRGWVLGLAFAPDSKKLASTSLDTTGVIWQMPSLDPAPIAKAWPADLEMLWEDLASVDAKAAYQALSALTESPEQAVAFFGKKLKPVAAPDPKKVAQLIADLDNQNFGVRQKATSELEKLAELAAPQLRSSLEKQPALEVARRIEKILDSIASQALPPEKLRDLRAVEALESIATPDARAMLRSMSQGAPGAHLTGESAAALSRLDKQTRRGQ